MAGELLHVSPSQAKEFDRCERKWVLNKVFRIPQPKRESQDRGQRWHGELEDYYLRGKPLVTPSLQLLAEHHFPKPGPGLLIEHPRDYNLGLQSAGVKVKGRMDLLDLTNPVQAELYDLKTTKNLAYAKTEEELAWDLQMVIYAHWVFLNYPAVERVRWHHGYAQTEYAGAKLVSTEAFTRREVKERWHYVEGLVVRMKLLAGVKDFTEARPNEAACGDFKGCPYRYKCWPDRYEEELDLDDLETLEEDMDTQGTQGTQGLLDMIDQTRKAQNPTGPRATGINPPDAAKPEPTPSATTKASEAVVEGEVKTPEPGPQPLHIFVGCLPMKLAVNDPNARMQYLEELIEARTKGVLEAVAKSEKKPALAALKDVREVPYGAGVAALVSSFKAEPPSGFVVALSGGGLTTQVVEALSPLAATLVVKAG